MLDLSRITVFCFAASYSVALGLEAAALWGKVRGWSGGGRRLAILAFAGAGLFAHTCYLVLRAREQTTPLSSPYDWSLLAALVLAAVYLAASFALRRWAVGLFLLPLVMALIGYSRVASTEPFAPDRASLFWSMTHGWMMLLATVAICVNLVTGLMYLLQSHRLKQKIPPQAGFGLPSLEWLEKAGGRLLAASTWLIAGGFGSGLVLSTLKNQGVSGYSLMSDPVVVALGALLVWLLIAEAMRYASPTPRRGRAIAALSIANSVLLAVTLVAITLVGSVHGTSAGAGPGELEGAAAEESPEAVSPQPDPLSPAQDE